MTDEYMFLTVVGRPYRETTNFTVFVETLLLIRYTRYEMDSTKFTYQILASWRCLGNVDGKKSYLKQNRNPLVLCKHYEKYY